MADELAHVDWQWIDDHPPPRDTTELVSGWIALQSADHEDPDLDKHSQFWASEAARRLTDSYPDLAFEFVVAVLAEKPDDVIRYALAAGPLEDLLNKHGPTLIDRIEAQAAIDPLFRDTLRGVWPSGISPDIWERIQAAHGNQPAP